MKKIHIIYATNSGGTEEACEIVRDVLSTGGHMVALQSASKATPDDFRNADLLIFASPTWERITSQGRRDEGQLQHEWRECIERIGALRLDGQRVAVIGFGDTRFANFAAAADQLADFAKTNGATLVGEILRVDRFFFRLNETRRQVQQWAERLLREPALVNV